MDSQTPRLLREWNSRIKRHSPVPLLTEAQHCWCLMNEQSTIKTVAFHARTARIINIKRCTEEGLRQET